jgi:hypothetical protein
MLGFAGEAEIVTVLPIEREAVLMHPPVAPHKLYVVAASVGVTVTESFRLFPAVALQVYEVAPLATSNVGVPPHTVAGPAILNARGDAQ